MNSTNRRQKENILTCSNQLKGFKQ